MIIYGSKSYKKTKGTGVFHCPECQTEQLFKDKHRQRHLHLYFIPLIPIGKKEDYIKCSCCRQRFIPEVVRPQASNLDEYLQQLTG